MGSKNGNGNGNGSKEARIRVLPDNDPEIIAFAMELVLTRGNASQAARNLGQSEPWGRRVIAKFPELRELAAIAVGRWAHDTLTEWSEMHARARNRIMQNLESEDDRVSQRAAEYIIERLEGKVPHVVRDDTPNVSLNSIHWRFIASLHVYRGFSVAEALSYAEKHPDEVEEWAVSRNLLPAGRDVS